MQQQQPDQNERSEQEAGSSHARTRSKLHLIWAHTQKMDAVSEESIRAEIADIAAIPYPQRSVHDKERLNQLEAEIRRRHPELQGAKLQTEGNQVFKSVYIGDRVNALLDLGRPSLEDGFVHPEGITAGDVVQLLDGTSVEIPCWLRATLPKTVSPAIDRSCVDLTLPTEHNPFFSDMVRASSNTQMYRVLHEELDWPRTKNHVLLLGSSGCGKTSSCLACAVDKYVLYLECPTSIPDVGGGFRMVNRLWSQIATPQDVARVMYVEVATRLVILINVLLEQGASFTPLRWLLYQVSDHCGRAVQRISTKIRDSRMDVDSGDVIELMTAVTELIQKTTGAKTGAVPVIVVDELQKLSARQVRTADGASSTAMKATIEALSCLPCPAVWSGTRMGVSAAGGGDSGIAKHIRDRELLVAGDFQFLDRATVREYLTSILDFQTSEAMLSQLSYLLQGRARMVTGFITHLLVPGSVAMQAGAVLDDAAVSSSLESFLEKSVVSRFRTEIAHLCQLPGGKGMSTDDVGYLWCQTMLHGSALTCQPTDCAHRLNSLAFTKRVVEDTEASEASGEVTYRFAYVFGEPALLEALLRIVWREPLVAEAGILAMQRSALTASVLGSYLDYAVVLALISKRSSVLRSLCENHRVYQRFQSYELHISRVVCTSEADKQCEWFQKVVADPDDDTFSLLPGVPVKNIAILPSVLSGADIICAAVRPSAPDTGDHAPTQEHSILQTSPPRPYLMRKRKLRSDAPQAETAPAATPTTEATQRIAFVQICCASYGKGVPSTKHLDQAGKCQEQFGSAKRRCTAGTLYRAVARQYADSFAYLPVLVEIPQHSPANSDEYVLVTEREAGALLGRAVVQVFLRENGDA